MSLLDTSSCGDDDDSLDVVRALPAGTIDAFFAGHTHRASAFVVGGVPVMQPLPFTQGLGIVDLWVDPAAHRVVRADGTGTGADGGTGGGTGTEEMRASLLEARALFDELVGASAGARGGHGPAHRREGGHGHDDRNAEGRETHAPARHKKWHKEERTA